ncbi:MAG: division/cell wall cluster transcriptional repressor MraZ [Nitrospirae bacterium RBG_16_43_11]|nr:MAG: division/cell wall cluster transcriptional repressor MraZ [Nitrospirae bacterium RBG_16_43_11]
MFRGRHLHTIDAKGRLSIPAKFRDIVLRSYGGQFILIKDLVDRCIAAYTPDGWDELTAKIQKASSLAEEVKAFRRLMFSEAEDCIIDKQGRILIPPRLREYASLEKDVLVAGVENNKIEFWNPQIWEEAMSAYDPRDIARKMAELGI